MAIDRLISVYKELTAHTSEEETSMRVKLREKNRQEKKKKYFKGREDIGNRQNRLRARDRETISFVNVSTTKVVFKHKRV